MESDRLKCLKLFSKEFLCIQYMSLKITLRCTRKETTSMQKYNFIFIAFLVLNEILNISPYVRVMKYCITKDEKNTS